jgi:hypothetical protein
MIHSYDQNIASGEDLIDNFILYTTFEKAAEALEVYIREDIALYNEMRSPHDKEEIFEKPSVTIRSDSDYCHYYETFNNNLYTITKLTVAE